MLRYLVYSVLLLALPVSAQSIVRQHIIANGYENDRLIRNHLVVKYYNYSPTVTDGFVLRVTPSQFSENPGSTPYVDTLCRFAGDFHDNQRFGTFLFFPMDNVFYLETYSGYARNGLSTGFYYDGTLHSQIFYKKNRLVGIFRKYYTNGTLAILKKLHEKPSDLTEYQSYYVNGNMSEKGLLYSGKKVNEWKYYTPSGDLCKIEYYNLKGRLLAVRPKDMEQ